MGFAPLFALPLAAMAMSGDALPKPDADSARFADVLVTAYVCEHLGFTVDYDGLARWGDGITEVFVAAGTAPKDALANVRRDIRADFEKAFGEPPGALLGLAIMTDTDNTRSTTRAWYGAIRLQ